MSTEIAEERAMSESGVEIRERVGYLPALFVPALENPAVLDCLWRETQVAYLDNPLPAHWKEQVFAYLSRFSTSPYCLVVHSCRLSELGMPLSKVLSLLEEPATRLEGELGTHLSVLAQASTPMAEWPPPDHPLERAIFACTVAAFLRRSVAPACVAELRRLLAPPIWSRIALLLSYIRVCHGWTEAHPEIAAESEGKVSERLDLIGAEEPRLIGFFRNHNEIVSTERAAKEKALQAEIARLRRESVELETRVQEESVARRREYEERRQAEEQRERFFEVSRDLICIAGNDGFFKMLNAAWKTVLGFPTEELLRRPYVEFVHVEDRERTLHAITGVMQGRDLTSFENRFLCQDGSHRWLEWTVSAVRPGESLMYATARDITDRVRAQEDKSRLAVQMFEGQKLQAIGRLAAGIAHEINNPLGYIMSNLGTIEGYSADFLKLLRAHEDGIRTAPERIRLDLERLRKSVDFDYLVRDLPEALKDATAGAERIRDIVRNLRDFAAPERDEPQSADLNALIENVLAICAGELKRKAEVRRDYGVLTPIRCHPQAVSQVFLNLVMNAAEAIETKGTLWVTSRLDGREVVVRIRDSGRGIDPKNLQKLFEPFFSTRPIGKGTGLGLYVAYRIVQGHGGTITAVSEPGRGSEFTIRLPVVSGKENADEG